MYINSNLDPISLQYIQSLIDRIHTRYPLIEKTDIVIIVRSFFEVIRDNLLACNIISINSLFTNMYLYFYNKNIHKQMTTQVKVKLTTPKGLK